MSTETLYDCAIVGGGLGGLCLSIQLAQNGFKVILFEKETYPFHKVCGEYISLESKQFLSSCGIYIDELQLPIIKKLQISAPSGYAIQAALPLGGFGISRFTLDQLLVNEATKLGVTVMQGTKVSQVKNNDLLYEIHAENLVYNSRIVAGSYGKRSRYST
jgi:flavin-dependent dehydrogenase